MYMGTIIDISTKKTEKLGTTIDFNSIKLGKKRIIKKDPTLFLNELENDPENISYGPFNNIDEALSFLDRDLG